MKFPTLRLALAVASLGIAGSALADDFQGDWYYDYNTRDGDVRVTMSLARGGVVSILVLRPNERITGTGKWYDRGNYADLDFPRGADNNGRSESMRMRFSGGGLVPDRWNRDVFGSRQPRFTTKRNSGNWGGSGGSGGSNVSPGDGFPNFREGRWRASSGRGDFGRVRMELIADRNGDATLRNRFDRRDEEELTGTWRLRRGILEFNFTRSNQRSFRRETLHIRDTGNWTATSVVWDRQKYGSAPLRFSR